MRDGSMLRIAALPKAKRIGQSASDEAERQTRPQRHGERARHHRYALMVASHIVPLPGRRQTSQEQPDSASRPVKLTVSGSLGILDS